jgi:hypothetical protein
LTLICTSIHCRFSASTPKNFNITQNRLPDCSDPKKLDLTVVAFVAATVFIMLLHAATDIPLGLASPIVP